MSSGVQEVEWDIILYKTMWHQLLQKYKVIIPRLEHRNNVFTHYSKPNDSLCTFVREFMSTRTIMWVFAS